MAFTVATWNILATAYIQRRFYPRTPAGVLDPACRVPVLARRAAELAVDVLCLQEVETDVFSALQTALGGYTGTHALQANNRHDGCAIFFRTDGFTAVSDERVVYRDGEPASGHIAQRLALEREGRRLAVLNTHLKWDPPGTARERQWGYRQVTRAIDLLRADAGAADGEIVCGDLNVTPASDVVGALMDAGFDYAHRECPGVCTCNANGEPALIDYLFHSRSLLARPLAAAPIGPETLMPSREQPSDHLPLVAEFEWRETGL